MSTSGGQPPVFKAIGISLAFASGVFIGISFVLKKVGLLKANVRYNEEAGEGYGYLKNFWWWGGMTLMIIGEICNFVAYAFVDAILVTPLGALSVVITTILSAIFLKERLSFIGMAGCFLSIVGSIVIVLNAPQNSSVHNIQDMQHLVLTPGFLSYAGVIIIGSLFVIFWVGPRYGKKSMLVYLTVCSLIGGLSVVATQGLGAAIVTQIGGTEQYKHWFLYVLFVFVICTLLTEIVFLNKALNLFNASLVTPTYYVYFTSATIVTSAVLFQGFPGSSGISIATMAMGFLVICTGVILLQLSKSAKDVPDTQVFTGEVDQIRTIAEQEQPESEPKADAIRGTAAIIRSMSTSRRKMEAAEAKQVQDEKLKDQMETIGENEQVEWDGLRRRKTIRIDPSELQRRKSMHPPLGRAVNSMVPFDDDQNDNEGDPRFGTTIKSPSFFQNLRSPRSPGAHAHMPISPSFFPQRDHDGKDPENHLETIPSGETDGDAVEMEHVFGLPPGLEKQRNRSRSTNRSPGETAGTHGKIAWAQEGGEQSASRSTLNTPTPHSGNRRQFSFQNIFGRGRDGETPGSSHGRGAGSSSGGGRARRGSRGHNSQPSTPSIKVATEEERLGLVVGDSKNHSESPSDDERTPFPSSSNRDRDAAPSAASIRPVLQDTATLPSSSSVTQLQIPASQGSGGSSSDPSLRTPGLGRPLPLTPPAYDSDEDGEKDVEKLRSLQHQQVKRRSGNSGGGGGGGGGGDGRDRRDGAGGGGFSPPPGRNASPPGRAPGGASFI